MQRLCLGGGLGLLRLFTVAGRWNEYSGVPQYPTVSHERAWKSKFTCLPFVGGARAVAQRLEAPVKRLSRTRTFSWQGNGQRRQRVSAVLPSQDSLPQRTLHTTPFLLHHYHSTREDWGTSFLTRHAVMECKLLFSLSLYAPVLLDAAVRLKSAPTPLQNHTLPLPHISILMRQTFRGSHHSLLGMHRADTRSYRPLLL
jgi:hypothetical protein